MSKGRLLAVSDVHGYGQLLLKLLARAAYDPGKDQLIMLGDYINKGPDSIGTLHDIYSLCQEGAIALTGNNELRWIASGDVGAEQWQSFLRSLPLWTEVGNFLFVHAGIRPGLSLDQQTAEDMTETNMEAFLHITVPGKTIVFGHTPTFRLGAKPGSIWLSNGKIGIDTGAGHSCRLSLVDLTGWKVYSIGVSAQEKSVDVAIIPSGTSTHVRGMD